MNGKSLSASGSKVCDSRYREVRRASGAGDKGRDVIGYVGEVNCRRPWDNFQCKHYDHALYPSDLWKELAKLCYYTFDQTIFSAARLLFCGSARRWSRGSSASGKAGEHSTLGLIAKWEKGDLLKIAKKEVQLEGDLRQYVDSFDFTIIKDAPPAQIIAEHRETRYHAAGFGGGLVRLPPDKADVPEKSRTMSRVM